MVDDSEDLAHVQIEVTHGLIAANVLLVKDAESEADVVDVLHGVFLGEGGREGGREGGGKGWMRGKVGSREIWVSF